MMQQSKDKIRWVWFDIDDTLYDFRKASLAALHEVYLRHGLSRRFATPEAWVACYHRHNDDLWRLYNRGEVTQQELRVCRFTRPLAEAGAEPSADLDAFSGRLDCDYLDCLARQGITVKGAHEVLRTLRDRGFRIGVLSNGFNGIQQQKLISSGLMPLVDLVVLSDEAGVCKPARGLFDYARRKAEEAEPGSGATPMLLVGDNPETDVAGALDAGWSAVWFLPGACPADVPKGAVWVGELAQIPALPVLMG